ncbi:reverse transcriptase domain-containing protein [Clostridium beijerinckii]|uniref:reverse transcriptase domain-containing protein n=1 Tax=Clostridium beijerinckii TaxID=1520 RepID=UPI00149504A1|nr:reverse transcriptase domain-containing protein [Clostridium beijerinckii]NOW04437.1 putative MPP superfamily phosphohydrolase [Clostridium beijerinckii]NYC02421.1 putative MPP superfamily phosphohydrolase [Clostridium beijerinckii]
MNFFTEQNFRIAWNQCRKFNYNNYNNFGLMAELEFYDKHIEAIIKDIIRKINTRSFVFSNKYIVYVPKENGLLRRISIATLEDQLVLQVILNSVGSKIDKNFIYASYGNRIESKKGKLSTYIFKPYYKQFNSFINSVIYNIEKGYSWVCETDITAYFDTISHSKLESILIERLGTNNSLNNYSKDLIIDFLKTDIIENGQIMKSERGIPQSMPLSSFLGNLYLDDIDHDMKKNNDIIFCRYVDDIRILGKSEKIVKEALIYLQKSLLLKDLYINNSKTCIYKVDSNSINKQELRVLQHKKLSIETVTEKDFQDIINLKNINLNENEIKDVKLADFNELQRIVDRRNKLVKQYLIKKNINVYFKYLSDFLNNNPKYYYLVKNIRKYQNKVDIEQLDELYGRLIESPYEVIAAQSIGDVINFGYLYKTKISININEITNCRIMIILLQILIHKDCIKSIIKKSLQVDDKSFSVIIKPLLLELSELKISVKWKKTILDKIIKRKILLKDTYLYLYILFKDIINNKEIIQYIEENYPYTFRSHDGKVTKSLIEEDYKDNMYENVNKYKYDIFTIKNIIYEIAMNLPEQYKKNPSFINPYNINIEMKGKVHVNFLENPINIKNKIPEEFIMIKSTNELKITYMIGVLWFCMFAKDSISIYNKIVPYVQMSLVNYLKNNPHEFQEHYRNYGEEFNNDLHYINMAVKKSPSSRITIYKILKKIMGESEKKMINKSEANINILHLSDIHFGIEPTGNGKIDDNQVADRTLVLRSLIKELDKLPQEWIPNAIVISGDIGWKGRTQDYNEAKLWITELMRKLNIDSSRLIVCPGNHDLNRDIAKYKNIPQNCSEADDFLSNRNVHGYADYFNDYQEFAKQLNIKTYKFGSKEGYLSGVLIIDGFRFIILNSAWFSRGNNDQSKLWIGLPIIKLLEANNQIENNDEYINIGVLHHPKEWLAYEEIHKTNNRRNTYNYLAEMTHFILSGHVHAKPEKSDLIAGNSHLIVGGSTYIDGNYDNNCSIIKIDKNLMRFERAVLEYKPSDGEWNIIYDYESKDIIKKNI